MPMGEIGGSCSEKCLSDQEENAVAELWSEALNGSEGGVHASFLESGGDSLQATMLLASIEDRWGVRLRHDVVLGAADSCQLARSLQEGLRMAGSLRSSSPASETMPTTLTTILSHRQRALWFLCRLNPDLTAYNICFSVRISGRIGLELVHRCLADVVRRHDALRTTFGLRDGDPVRVVAPAVTVEVPVIDLRPLPPSQRDERIRTLAYPQKPFDLESGPLFRFAIGQLGDEDSVVRVVVHHLVFDSWSIGVFFRDFLECYLAATSRTTASPLPYQYGSHVLQQARSDRKNREADARYWIETLAGCPDYLPLPLDHPRPAVQTYRGSFRQVMLSAQSLARLKEFSRRRGVTLFASLLTTFQVLLHRYTQQSDILVGCPVACRQLEESRSLGYFDNVVVMRAVLSGDERFTDVLSRSWSMAVSALDHQSFPVDRLVDQLHAARNPSHNPLFQVMFAHHAKLPGPETLPGLCISIQDEGHESARLDLTLETREIGGELQMRCTFNTDLFEPSTIERFLVHYQRLLHAAVERPESAIGDLPMLTADEEEQILVRWNETARPYPKDHCIHTLFAMQAERVPDAVALTFDGTEITYRRLADQARVLARYLRAHGVKEDVPVGVFVERSPLSIIALLGILQAGGAFLALDPTYPRERIAFMLEDSGASIVLSTRNLAEELPSGFLPILLDQDWDEIAQPRESSSVLGCGELSVSYSPQSLAYVMYTSGSTGKPKGVLVPHEGVCNYLYWMQDRFRLTPADRVLNKASMSFDVSVWEVFWPLMVGASVALAPEQADRNVDQLARMVREQTITAIQFVPAALKAFCSSGALASCQSLRLLFCGGEELTSALRDAVHAQYDGPLHNLYGPTEASIFVTHWACDPTSPADSPVPIGRPVSNAKVYVLDPRLKPVPVGVAGELFLGGSVLARGYHRRPDLTARQFLADPFSQEPGARLYRTGDRARYRPDGVLEFLGRNDDQVKVRGHRIELGEIEHTIELHPQVRESVVVVQKDGVGEGRIVAYVVPAAKDAPSPERLREHLRDHLPMYMVPAAFVTLDKIPTLSNGKVNRKALPAPGSLDRKSSTESAGRWCCSHYEQALLAIWKEALNVDDVGPEDSFFDVGGHSLLVVKVRDRIERQLGNNVELLDLFRYPTIRSLARILADESDTDSVRERARESAAKRAHWIRRNKQERYEKGKNDKHERP